MRCRSVTIVGGRPRTFSGGPWYLLLLAVHSAVAFVPPNHQHHNIGSLHISITQTSQSTIEPSSVEDILKDIDIEHYHDANKLCSYLESEAITSAGDKILQEYDTTIAYHSSASPVLSDEAINTLRTTAQSYFEKKRESNNGAWGMEKVDLGELLVSNVAWKKELDDALTQNIYPLIRSGWPTHDAFFLPNSSIVKKGDHQQPVLTVTSATVVAGCGCPGTKATLTTLERDAGLFVVHIDLGNDGQVANNISSEDTSVMGALYLESLIGCEIQSNPIVGPLKPGQMVVHRSIERTSAIVVPSDIHSLEQQNNKSSLDTLSRRHILKAAEGTRHYALRLVLTTKTESNDESDIPEAPSEERSYRLRTFSRLLSSRMRYLTLASEIDLDDSENQFWLGFDYLAKVAPDNQLEVHQQLSYIDKAVFHLEKAATLCPTDARVHFQLATTLKAKMEWEKRLLTEEVDGDSESKEVYLTRMADALERSVQLESAAVRVCAMDTSDLANVLSTLAETRCKMGEFEEALNVIDKWAECGSLRSALAIEDRNHQLQSPIPSYKWIQTQGDEDTNKNILNRRDVAVATVGDVRVFEPEDISLLRAAADKHFAQAAGKQTSRYTMQYEGNTFLYLFCHLFFK
jgi:tetratricopeptide (TPR) repeat protein